MSAKKTKELGTGFNDNAVDTDKLGMETKCSGVASFLSHCNTPMTLAIQGDWGTGKSTCMKLIINHLKKANPNLCLIEFNTWQFSLINDGSTLIEDLLNVMCREFERLKGDGDRSKERDKEAKSTFSERRDSFVGKIRSFVTSFGRETLMDNIITRAVLCGKDAFSDKENAQISPEAIELVREMASRPRTDSSARVLELCENIKGLVEELTSSTNIGDRIFVFIDDLDRLQPELAVGLMECLKNFMDFPGFVFVLAVDRPVVDIGLKAKYGKDFDKAKAQYFFDKIIQVPFTLPVNSYDIESYIKVFLGDKAEESIIKKYVGLLTDFDESNPRSIKRSFNVLQLYEYMMMADANNQGSLDPQRKFRLYSLLLLQLLREEEYKALTDLIISFGENTELLRADLSAAIDPEAREGGDPPEIELSDMQKVVLRSFLSEEKTLGTADAKDLISFAELTNENSSERGEDKIVNVAKAICSRLIDGSLMLTSGWEDLMPGSKEKDITSIYAEAHDPDGKRRLTLKWGGKSRKLNLSLYPADMTSDTDRSRYFSGLEDFFYEKKTNGWWVKNKYAYFYAPDQGRITVTTFDRYVPNGPLDTLMIRCGVLSEAGQEG